MELHEEEEPLHTLVGESALARVPLPDALQYDAIWSNRESAVTETPGGFEEGAQEAQEQVDIYLWRATQSLGFRVARHVTSVPDEAKDSRLSIRHNLTRDLSPEPPAPASENVRQPVAQSTEKDG